MRRLGDRRLGVAPKHVHRRQHVLLGVVRGQRREDGRQRLDPDDALGFRRRAARQLTVMRNDREHRLAEVVHFAVGEDRVVVDDRPALVRAGDVGGGDHRDDARLLAQRLDVDGQQLAVRHRRKPQRRMQRAGGFEDVVRVGGLAGHVQVGRLVRPADADARAVAQALRLAGGLQQEGFDLLVHHPVLLKQGPRRAACRSTRWSARS